MANRLSTWAHTLSMSNGRSGMRMMFAPPARPQCRAIQPAWRPITSTTSTRWCDSAVVCSRSIASIAMLTAVSKPKVKSVPDRSLSIVLGTPTTLTPRSDELGGDAQRVLAADGDQRVAAVGGEVVLDLLDAALDRERVGARRAEDRAAARQDAAHLGDAQRHRVVLERAPPAVAEADELVAVLLDALADRAADDRVQAGAVAAAGQHADAHRSSCWFVDLSG